MSSRRMMRLNEVLRRDVSARLLSEVKDPRIGFITVLKAEIADDYTRADIFVSVLEEEKIPSTLKALNRMKGFFQKDLSKTLGTRLTPILTFKCDQSTKHAVTMDILIEKARQTDSDHQANAPRNDSLPSDIIENSVIDEDDVDEDSES